MQLKSLLENLDLLDKSELFYFSDIEKKENNLQLPFRVKESLVYELKPDALFCINNEPLILFFERDIPKNLEKQIWNFNQSPAIFVNTDTQWIIKNGFKLLQDKTGLDTISNNISDFEYFKIITGQTWQDFKHLFKNENRVDYSLLNNIEAARNILTIKGNLHPKTANSLIGRVIFIRYLIDRKVELNKYNILEINDFYNILSDSKKAYTFFQQIRSDFNGNLFPLEYLIDDNKIKEQDIVESSHLNTIISLLKGDSLSYSGETQISLFDIYDFSIIPIEFISNVYEKFIGVENQAKKGAYYTPLFLVDYIQKETVSLFFKRNPKKYNCKVLDPACGSGIFLVETLRQIIAQYLNLNPIDVQNDVAYDLYKEKLKKLLKDNIFGIDKDENAISVAIFSLYITLLDNLKPKSIVGFQFPELEDSNFFVADFFNKTDIFNSILKEHYFQFILGNPPWATKHPSKKQSFEIYIEELRNEQNSSLDIVQREIAEAFLIRVGDFNFDETAFIVVSKILYKSEKNGVFRKHFLNTFSLRQVVELSSVRHHIFSNSTNDKAIAPAAILFYSKPSKSQNNLVKHISLKPNIFFESFKIMMIEKYDIKEISQNFLLKEDWLWKVLVYGNILDYLFIKRLKNSFKSIDDITSKNFLRKRGLQRTKNKKNISTKDLIGLPFINTQKKELKNYHIKSSKTWDEDFVAICPPKEIFKAPMLLSTKGVDSQFNIKSAISYKDAVFTDSLFAIKAYNNDDIDMLKAISAIWNSSLSTVYSLLTASSIGIEREQIHIKEKLSIPFSYSFGLVSHYETLEELSTIYNSKIFEDDLFIWYDIEETKIQIENELIEIFAISKQEYSLMDYAKTITIPLLKGNKNDKKIIYSKIEFEDAFLEEYAQIFYEHFANRFNSDKFCFEIDILHSNHTILMKFKIIPQSSNSDHYINWKNNGDKELLKKISDLNFENLSNSLYLQKDIKGFEKDFFYVAKPNEYKLWHPAIAHLDLTEFVDALHKQKK